MKNILIAPDKFKGSLSARSICQILEDELVRINPKLKITSCPMADGGDGSVDILAEHLSLDRVEIDSVDPLKRPIKASYYVSQDAAFIELATASGLVLLDSQDRNPMHTSTFGSGLLIKDAIVKGKKDIYLFLGGSATNDGGIGIASALGIEYLDKDGNNLDPVGSSLVEVKSIVDSDILSSANLHLCCDVDNVPYGPNGAAIIYGKQKGGNEADLKRLDDGIKNLCLQIKNKNGRELDHLVGGGAAGAVAVSLAGLFDAKIISGIDYMSSIIRLEQKIKEADIVISGEGRIDNQSMNGKVISGVSRICNEYNKKLYLVAGQNILSQQDISSLNVEKVFTISELASDIDDAMNNGATHLKEMAKLISKELSFQ